MTEKQKNIKGAARIRTVRVGDLRVSGAAQREFKQSWGDTLAENFSIDKMATLVVSHRDGVYWIIDGQHRHFGLKAWAKQQFGDDWADWTVEVWSHEGLNEQDEADLFLSFNNRRAVSAFDKFKVGVTANLSEPSDINRVVLALGLKVDKGRKANAVAAVGALTTVYRSGGAVLLSKTLVTIRDAWAGVGFEPESLNGVALFISRYEGRLDEARLVSKLAGITNGSRGLRQRAIHMKETYGDTLNVCTAAAITELYNKGLRGTNSLGSWWKETGQQAA